MEVISTVHRNAYAISSVFFKVKSTKDARKSKLIFLYGMNKCQDKSRIGKIGLFGQKKDCKKLRGKIE